MILQSLPDCKSLHPSLTVGKDYEIISTFGTNGYVIQLDDKPEKIIILASRFTE